MRYIGSHLSLTAPDYFLGTVKKALSLGENTFMFYTGAPQNTIRLPLSALKIEEGKQLWLSSGHSLNHLVIHAPYIINPASMKPNTREIAIEMLAKELDRAEAFGVPYLVLHPGSDVDELGDAAFTETAKVLDLALEASSSKNTLICLETMAGKGHEIGRTFDAIATLRMRSAYPDRLGVCLDTCHINDAGYPVANVDQVLDEFDRIIGLNHLKVIHLNDSKNPMGSHKDRHENIGYGTLGFETLEKWFKHPKLEGVPFELETPWLGKILPYRKEIEMLRSGQYETGWRETLIASESLLSAPDKSPNP